jgi:hypothetical protein
MHNNSVLARVSTYVPKKGGFVVATWMALNEKKKES